MCTIEKPATKWKAGQCVTIEGKRCRIAKPDKSDKNFVPCKFCEFKFKKTYEYPCDECIDGTPYLIPRHCYFKRIKPKY